MFQPWNQTKGFSHQTVIWSQTDHPVNKNLQHLHCKTQLFFFHPADLIDLIKDFIYKTFQKICEWIRVWDWKWINLIIFCFNLLSLPKKCLVISRMSCCGGSKCEWGDLPGREEASRVWGVVFLRRRCWKEIRSSPAVTDMQAGVVVGGLQSRHATRSFPELKTTNLQLLSSCLFGTFPVCPKMFGCFCNRRWSCWDERGRGEVQDVPWSWRIFIKAPVTL